MSIGRVNAFDDGPWLVLEFRDGTEVLCYDYATRAEAEEALIDELRQGGVVALARALDIEVDVSVTIVDNNHD